MLDLTIVIPVRNEAANLQECLDSIGIDFASQVVVVDSGSDDGTAEIATSWGAALIVFRWNGQFPKKRNWFLRSQKPSTRWVLFLDADEFLTTEFKKELQAVLPLSKMAGYWLRYSIHFLGKELKYGYPLDKLALFRVGKAEYERIEESTWSSLDMEIHEHPIVDGPVGHIRARIDHRDNRDLSHYIAKHNEYSSWEAKRFIAQARKCDGMRLTFRQRIKYSIVNSPFAGPLYFIGAYFVLWGVLDGARGLAFAVMKAAYFNQVYCKIREQERACTATLVNSEEGNDR